MTHLLRFIFMIILTTTTILNFVQAQEKLTGVSSNVCSHKGIIKTLANMRRVCLETCDIDKLVQANQMMDLSDLLSIFKEKNRWKTIVFYFRTGSYTLHPKEKKNKLKELRSILSTSLADGGENTAAFIIGTASTTGDRIKNRKLSAKRMKSIANLIENEANSKCKDHFYSFLGHEVKGKLTHSDAKKYEVFSDDDLKVFNATEKRSNRTLDNYVNQSVIVFTYPCVREMCGYLKSEAKAKNDDACDESSEYYFPECCK